MGNSGSGTGATGVTGSAEVGKEEEDSFDENLVDEFKKMDIKKEFFDFSSVIYEDWCKLLGNLGDPLQNDVVSLDLNTELKLNQIDYFWRVTMLGDEGTGKTSIFKRYTIGNSFTGPGIVDTGTRYLKLPDNKIVKLTLVSHPTTINQPNFEEIIQNSIKDSVGFILVYDITNPDSLRRCSTFWSPIVRKHANYLNAPLFLLASKTDLLQSTGQLRTGSLQLNTIPLKVSAKESTDKEVNLLFEYVTSVIHKLMQSNQITPKTSYLESPSRTLPVTLTTNPKEEDDDLPTNQFEIGNLQLDGSEEDSQSHVIEVPVQHTISLDSPHLQ